MNEILVSAGNLSVSYYKKNYLSDQMWGESEQSFFHSFCLHAVSWVCCSPWWKLVMHVPWGNKFLRVLIIAIFVGFFFVICKLLQNKLTPLAKLYSHTNITSTGTVDSCLPFKTSLSYRNKTMKWETKHSKFYRKGLSEETPLKTIFYSWILHLCLNCQLHEVGMLFPCIEFPGTHLYTWEERGTVRVKCLVQEHNTMSLARAQTCR